MNHQQYINLVEELILHDLHYYDENKPLISDYEYDQKMQELLQYEKKHPEQILPHSPSRRIKEAPTEGFRQRAHLTPMMSINNTYSEEEIDDFIHRVHKLLEKKEVDFCCELKIDGTSISLRYENGNLIHALTRGNGQVGDDVTANIKTIPSVPLKLTGSHFPPVLEIRGEIYMTLATFHALNTQREEEGLEVFANPRNAAAGSLKLLDPEEAARRKLNLITYAIGEGQAPVPTQHEIHPLLKKWGLPVAKQEHIAVCRNLEEITGFAEKIRKERAHLPFEIDGIVIKVDDLAAHKKLGVTGKAPRYAAAYKFAPEQAYTCIRDITVQVGRTGVLTPVAELEPVPLAGSLISRATLHNKDEIARKDIRIGDWVLIEKGGDVIPKVVQVDFKKRPADSHPWHMPKTCPICKTPTFQVEGQVAVRCPNPHCAGQQIRRIIYFASKQAMDIEHMGERVVEMLVEKGLIARPSDIYKLDEKALAQLDGFKEKSIQNLLKSIDASRKCSLARFIMALGIKSVGVETATLLAEEARSIESLMKMKVEDLIAFGGIGEKTAQAIVDYFQNEHNREEIHRLLANGIHPQKLKEKIQGHPFAGKTFVLTGSLPTLSREEATALIKERGGHVSASVSKNTDYVLVGEEPGSKYEKALKLKIPILSEDEFLKMV